MHDNSETASKRTLLFGYTQKVNKDDRLGTSHPITFIQGRQLVVDVYAGLLGNCSEERQYVTVKVQIEQLVVVQDASTPEETLKYKEGQVDNLL